MHARFSVALLLFAACGLEEAPSPIDAAAPPADGRSADAAADVPDATAAPEVRRGLSLRAQVEHPTPSPHLVELALLGDVFYVANSNDAFGAYLLEPDGGLLTTFRRPPPSDDFVRCTTLAVHPESHTLFCSSDEAQAVRAYDVSDPRLPVLRDPEALVLSELFTRDIAVIGDELWLSRFDRGLWVSSISEGGQLGDPMPTRVSGNVRFVDGSEPMVALSSDKGLLVLAGEGPETEVRARVALDGTPQDLRVVDGVAVVALGSDGVALVDVVRDVPEVVRTVRPPAVATAADLRGDALAVTTLTGAYLYDLRTTPARLAGFAPAGREIERDHGVMLHGRFAGDDFVVSDWTFVERYAVDLDGEVLDLDHPRGLYLAPGEDAVVPFRNDGALPMEVTLALGATRTEATVAPGETVRLVVAGATLSATDPPPPDLALSVVNRIAGRTISSRVKIVLRPENGEAPSAHPAPGDLFPTVAMADHASEVLHLPMDGGRQRLVFYTTDCAAMWTAIEDAALLSRRGELDGGAELHLLGRADIGFGRWDRRWGLKGVRYGHYDSYAPPEVMEENGTGFLYEERFRIDALPSAASFPTDYVVGADGRVERVERFYRGAYPLR